MVSHTPVTTADLVMHKKKIQEIGGWLELQKEPGLKCRAPRLLVLTGEPPKRAFVQHVWAHDRPRRFSKVHNILACTLTS